MPDALPMPLTLAAFTWIDWGVVGAYLLVVLLIGFAASRKQEDEGEFFLAGRRIPMWAATLSLVATSLSAATYIGAPQISFNGDLSCLVLNIGGLLAVAIVALLFLPSRCRANTTTIYGYLGQRISPGSATAAAAAFLVGRLLASGARLFMAAIAFCLIRYGENTLENMIYSIIILGVVGALVLRGIFIAGGAALIENFSWVLYVFAAFLLVTGYKMLRQRDVELADIRREQRYRNGIPVSGGKHTAQHRLEIVDVAIDGFAQFEITLISLCNGARFGIVQQAHSTPRENAAVTAQIARP